MIIYRKQQRDYSTKIGRSLMAINKNILRKPKVQAGRSAVKGERRIKELKKSINEVAYNPGKTVNEGLIRPVIETPVTAVTLGAAPIPGASALVKVVGKPEKSIYRKLGWSKKMEKWSNKYPRTRVAQGIENGINAAVGYGKMMFV